MPEATILQADLTYLDDRFVRDVRIAIDEHGIITAVGDLTDAPTKTLPRAAIVPGMINAHSHAFQRGLRGLGETFPQGAGSFWTWREQMYKLVQAMGEQQMYDLSHRAFTEMRHAGITTVGEFHYLHHDETNRGYSFDETILRAAADAGLRIVLLNVYYQTGGLGKPLSGGQQRFASDDLETFWAQMDRLESLIDGRMESLGVVAHSIRAVPIETIQSLHEQANQRHLPFHMHVEEQPQEIKDCVDYYGKTPMALLNEHLAINPHFTAVHCTHAAAADMDDFLNAGGNVCICPLTEANLGDGLANISRILKHDGHICLGTDSNSRINMTEEMRLLEYGQRLVGQTRGVCLDEHGRTAETLFHMATANGARALGIKAGAIKVGYLADLCVLDLDAPSLAGWTEQTLLSSFIYGTGNEAISATCVGGQW
jgi:formimidoylglutamate deiminase